MDIDVCGTTDIGKCRNENEDAFGIRIPRDGVTGLFLVCDGMGGKAGGRVASWTALGALLADKGLANAPSNDFVANARELSAAISRASTVVQEEALDNPELTGMGTTATVALLTGSTLIIGQVGDSRAYLLREGRLHGLTEDQTQFQRMVNSGGVGVDPNSDFALRARSTLTQSVGNRNLVPELTVVELRDGDTLLLCSDGLHGMLRPERIAHILGSADTAERAVYALIEAANRAGGHDNIGVVVARFSGEGLEPPTPADHGIGYPNCRFPLALL